ncbi:5142_t:CDS:2 [Paraglomus brasilianum]|uniref:5142_t:CDS:1 n=1 Tax=Paraglomus brasilianum TaxID=144538 RepID=A0A9N8VUK1_9GLOM|nr:5142_t:CDS:2 [Paraglomus brasilianum]
MQKLQEESSSVDTAAIINALPSLKNPNTFHSILDTLDWLLNRFVRKLRKLDELDDTTEENDFDKIDEDEKKKCGNG